MSACISIFRINVALQMSRPWSLWLWVPRACRQLRKRTSRARASLIISNITALLNNYHLPIRQSSRSSTRFPTISYRYNTFPLTIPYAFCPVTKHVNGNESASCWTLSNPAWVDMLINSRAENALPCGVQFNMVIPKVRGILA